MSLLQKIRQDLKRALKDRKDFEISVLRVLLSEIHNKEIEKKGTLEDDELLSVISKQIKKAKEARLEYQKGGREDLKQKEEKEIIILQKYLPAQLSEDEIRRLVGKVKKEVGAKGPADFGKVMKLTMEEIKGRAEGGVVAKITKELLET